METLVQQLINGLTVSSIYALIALGYTMVYGILRLINFAHGDVYMLGAFTGYFLARTLGVSAAPTLPGLALDRAGSMVGAAIIGLIIERVVCRPLRKYSRMTSLISAIGVSLLLENLGVVLFGAAPHSFPELLESQYY